MKNIHILPTDKPSYLYKNIIKGKLGFNKEWDIIPFGKIDEHIYIPFGRKNQHIYITSDEEVKEGDYCISHLNIIDEGKIHNSQTVFNPKTKEHLISLKSCKKIILTTDQDLIKDGVQSIDDEFLQWFVKNPSCEEVEVLYDYFQVDQNNPVFRGSTALVKQHKIIIPKEEPKQLTNLEIAIKLEEIEREEVREVKRTDLYNSILSIVKQIPRENVESDAMDAPSCAYEIEQLFYKWQQERMYSEEEVRLMFSESFWASQEGYNITSNEIIEQFKKKMTQEFVPYKQALELKELGFDEMCFGCHELSELRDYKKGLEISWVMILNTLNGYRTYDDETQTPAPLYQQAFRWFREKYEYYVELGHGTRIDFYYTIYKDSVSIAERNDYSTYEEAENACINKLIEIAKNK
jgi:hypothetical protein